MRKSLLLFSWVIGVSISQAADVDIRMTSNNGSTKVSFQDSGAVEVGSVDSDGNANFASITSSSGSFILKSNTLQTGATFYVSSGTVAGQLGAASIRFSDGSVQNTTARTFLGTWGRANLAQNQTDLQLQLTSVTTAMPVGGSRVRMPYAGIVRGICVTGSAVVTAGTATFRPFKNAAALGSGNVVIDTTNSQFNCSSNGTGTFVAGDILDIRVTTSNPFTPTGSTEYIAYLVLEWTQ